MRKLKLKVEDLEVSTFAAAGKSRARGTVVGHKPPAPTSFHCEDTYVGYWTCDYTCDGCQGALTSPTYECGGCG